MLKITRAIATLGAVAGLGAAAMPLGVYAIDGSAVTSSVTTIQASVDHSVAIAINNVDGANDLKSGTLTLGKLIVNGGIVSKKLKVNVYTNDMGPVTLTISPAVAGQTSMIGTASSSNTIPANANLGNGNAGWAFREDSPNEPWQALTNGSTSIGQLITVNLEDEAGENTSETINGETYEYGDYWTIEFGAAASTATKADTYNAKVVFTATKNF